MCLVCIHAYLCAFAITIYTLDVILYKLGYLFSNNPLASIEFAPLLLIHLDFDWITLFLSKLPSPHIHSLGLDLCLRLYCKYSHYTRKLLSVSYDEIQPLHLNFISCHIFPTTFLHSGVWWKSLCAYIICLTFDIYASIVPSMLLFCLFLCSSIHSSLLLFV